ncbi:hypothetical protein THAOC_27307, partial [Thalassiosira oceanica]
MATGGPKKRKLNDPGAADQDGSQAAEAVPPRLVDVQDIQLLIDERISRVEESMKRQVDALVGGKRGIENPGDIPSSHWLNQGHGHQYIAEMKKLVKGIKNITKKLRTGNDHLSKIFLKTAVSLAHDDILLPHWSELSDAIQLRGEGDPLSFCLFDVQVNRSVQDMLSQSLVLKCDQVGLHRNRFDPQDGTNFAFEAIQNNPQLNVFSFENTIE